MSLVDEHAGRTSVMSERRRGLGPPLSRGDSDSAIDLRDPGASTNPDHGCVPGHSPIWGAVVAAAVSIPIWVLLIITVWVLAT